MPVGTAGVWAEGAAPSAASACLVAEVACSAIMALASGPVLCRATSASPAGTPLVSRLFF